VAELVAPFLPFSGALGGAGGCGGRGSNVEDEDGASQEALDFAFPLRGNRLRPSPETGSVSSKSLSDSIDSPSDAA